MGGVPLNTNLHEPVYGKERGFVALSSALNTDVAPAWNLSATKLAAKGTWLDI